MRASSGITIILKANFQIKRARRSIVKLLKAKQKILEYHQQFNKTKYFTSELLLMKKKIKNCNGKH